MTLIEMLVSVSILSVMILAFSTILVQSQRVISVSQTSRRSHAMAFAIARVIRGDFRRITQNGFLAICNRTDANQTPLMMFTTAGATQGAASDARGAGSLVCYSMCDNSFNTPAKKSSILWRPQYILSQFNGGQGNLGLNVPNRPEQMNIDLASIQLLPRREASPTPGVIDSIVEIPYTIASNWTPPRICVPPKSGSDIGQLWQALVMDCSNLSITWTDGTSEALTVSNSPPPIVMGNNLKWYGLDIKYPQDTKKWPNPLPPMVQQFDRTKVRRSNIADTEEDPSKYTDQFSYYALFTHDNQKVWPRAVRIRFTIYDKGMPDEFRGGDGKGGMEYEVICNIGE
jgi:type II secretory pathway pseudopilin PulG